jgi:hypothetical protein
MKDLKDYCVIYPLPTAVWTTYCDTAFALALYEDNYRRPRHFTSDSIYFKVNLLWK